MRASAIDASGVLLDGTKVNGPRELRQALVAKKTQFATAVTEKLLTYALGRGLQYYDAPAVREIDRAAAADGYRWSSLILAIVKSAPFQMRTAAPDRISSKENGSMFVTKKAISRRTVLRGAGTAVALPLLDAMIPAFAPAATTAPVKRFGVVYHPNGVIYDKWLPTGAGSEFELSPTLKGLEPFKDKLIVVTGLFSDQAEPLGDGGGDHSRACGSYLTGVHVKKSDSIVENAVSMDQIAAKAFERDTQLSSLQMTADENSLLGSCDLGYSCAYSARFPG